jgi:hypothetical protein
LVGNIFVETAFVASLGSGSKWVGSLVDWSTGIQNYNGAFECNLFKKNHKYLNLNFVFSI